MRTVNRVMCLTFAALLLLAVFSGCAEDVNKRGRVTVFNSFREIPGVTEDEIWAVEALRLENNSFTYAMTLSNETFIRENGEIGGYSAMFCQWLSELFGIPFIPVIYEWGDLLAGVESGEIDFTGELTPSNERRKTFFMTDAIAIRSVKIFRMADSRPISEVSRSRPLRSCFMEGSIINDRIIPFLPEEFETILYNDYDTVYNALKSGEADAFFTEHTVEAAFDVYGDVITDDFFPVIYTQVSLTTGNPALRPVISVVQKALENGSIGYLTNLYKMGENEYKRQKLFTRLTEEEKNYLQKNPVVTFAAEHDNYPISFYNKYEKDWQGIAFDVIGELEEFTGLSFQVVNDQHTNWPELLHLLETGEASMISELLRTEDREGLFLWPQTAIATDYFALISKSDFPNVIINDILRIKVGLMEDTAYASLFQSWFPDHMDIEIYESTDAAFKALEKGEVDMIMANVSQLIMITNYYERIGYKANIIFEYFSESTFGFHKDKIILCSIVDKALGLIDTRGISGHWMRKTYDYSVKLAHSQRPWLISAAVLLLCVLVLLYILFKRRVTEADERVRIMFDAMPLSAYIHNRNYDYFDCNESTVKLFGLSNKQEYIDKFEQLSPKYQPDGRLSNEKMAELVDTAFNEKYCRFEWVYQNLNGELIPCDVTFVRVKHNNEYILAVYARDLRELKVAITQINESRQLLYTLENILNGLEAMIYVTVPQTGEILFINDSMRRHYKIEGECIGQLCYKLLREGMNEICDFCPCRQLDKEPGKMIEWFEHDALTKRTYRNTDCYIEWIDARMVHLQHSVDITELNDAKEQAIEANRTKSSFLARMSHEIRSPMNVILGITEMFLEKEGLLKDTKEAFGKIYDSGYLLLSIINDLLDMSKIEAGKLELMPVNYDVVSMINDTIQLNVMRFDHKPIQFELQADENLPVMLFGDELRIKQILNNILTNAFKYTDAGKVILSVNAEYEAQTPRVTLIFRVSDTGRGMTFEQVDKMFDDYTRFSLEASSTTEGTGLGMGITKRLVDLMNGWITVDSELGKGSTFTVRLPQGIVEGADVLGRELAESISWFRYDRTEQKKKAPQIIREYMPYGKVLVVDDMEPNLYVARGLLSPYGLSIETVISGFEAVEKIRNGSKFDIILMDHFMPEMDGIETVKKIRALGYTQPIVALTANALSGQAEIFAKNGFDGFISKPVDIRQLNETLNRLIRDKYPIEIVEAARQLYENLKKKPGVVKMDLSYIKALVVDDFLPNLNIAAGVMRKYEMQVDCVLSGHEAVNRIKRGTPVYNFIFMDHLMPDMDGIETTRIIRSLDSEYAKNIPIIALTANEDDQGGQIFLDNGFQGVIHKPLSIKKFDVFINDRLHSITKDITVTAGKKEKNMVVDIPGVDQDKIMDLYDGDLDIYLPILRSYLSVIPATLDKIKSVSAETLPEYTIKVHGIKSTSEGIGAQEARKMAAELESLAKAGDLSGILAKNNALVKYVSDLVKNIQNWLARYDAK